MIEVQTRANQDFMETVNYITPQYPIYIRRGLLSTYHNYSAVSHWHEDIEFIYIISGSMQFAVNGEVVTMKQSEGLMVNSRNFHYGFSEKREECDFICVIIHPSLFSANKYVNDTFVKPFSECEAIPYILLTGEEWHREALQKVYQIYALSQESATFYLDCQQLVIELFTILYGNNESVVEAANKNADKALKQLRQMVHYIQNHYAEALTLESIAKEGMVGKTTCCQLFKKYMHATPVDYLLACRMAQSAPLLAETDKTITEIAYEVGFRDASYYTKYFKKYYGMTPREMRKDRAGKLSEQEN